MLELNNLNLNPVMLFVNFGKLLRLIEGQVLHL